MCYSKLKKIMVETKWYLQGFSLCEILLNLVYTYIFS